MKRLLSIDPGKMTGIAEWDIEDLGDPKLLETHELEQMPLCAYVEEKLRYAHSYDIVMERYVIGEADAPWSLEVIGAVRYLNWKQTGRDYVELQTPGDAKSFADNERLRALGFWHVGGAGHANDAIRHGVLYMVREYFWHSPKLL
jgi:hypothetical protein